MAVINNDTQISKIEKELDQARSMLMNPMILNPFARDFSLRFCWSSNAIEGNTLDLEETVSVIEYDEVKSGHTYTEYQEAKNLYRAICEQMIPFQKRQITEQWIKAANGLILGRKNDYRTNPVYIGTLVEAVYYPPEAEKVPGLMEDFVRENSAWENSLTDCPVKVVLQKIAEFHMQFEQIHPFQDGNGRAGRMILNQQLINQGLIPLCIGPRGKYRQAFRQYEKNQDLSLIVYTLCKGELDSIQLIQDLTANYNGK